MHNLHTSTKGCVCTQGYEEKELERQNGMVRKKRIKRKGI